MRMWIFGTLAGQYKLDTSGYVQIYASEDVKSGTNYEFWIIQSVKNGQGLKGTTGLYAFYGETYFRIGNTDYPIDLKPTAFSTKWNSSEYAYIADVAEAGATYATTLDIFPRTKGERANYKFTFKFQPTTTPSDVITEDQKIWIRFDATKYDYYLGAGYKLFAEDVD